MLSPSEKKEKALLSHEEEDYKVMKCRDRINIRQEEHFEGWLDKIAREHQSSSSPSNIPPPNQQTQIPCPKPDYYHRPLEWTTNNKILIASNDQLYLHNPSTSQTFSLLHLPTPSSTPLPSHPQINLKDIKARKNENHNSSQITKNELLSYNFFNSPPSFTSLKANPLKPHLLSLSHSTSHIQLFDMDKSRTLRTMVSPNAYGELFDLQWQNSLLAAGGYDGILRLHDVRIKESLIAQMKHHTESILSLDWRNHSLLSSGNNGQVLLWDVRNLTTPSSTPLSSPDSRVAILCEEFMMLERSTVKYCRFHKDRDDWIVTGGGALDQHVRLWDIHNCVESRYPRALTSVSIGAQVCDVLMMSDGSYVVGSGYGGNEVCFLDSSMAVTGRYRLSGSRVLALAKGPDDMGVGAFAAWTDDGMLSVWGEEKKTPVTLSFTDENRKPSA